MTGGDDGARRALVVDDCEVHVLVVRRVLAKAGIECDAAATGEDALEVFRPGEHALVLLDVELPGMDGFETCRRLRAAAPHGVHVVFLTTLGESFSRDEALQAGGDDVMFKPIVPSRIAAVSRRHCLESAPQAAAGRTASSD